LQFAVLFCYSGKVEAIFHPVVDEVGKNSAESMKLHSPQRGAQRASKGRVWWRRADDTGVGPLPRALS
jgi:hypothetical protein